MNISPITFMGKPGNYAKIDEYVSRSAQPMKEDFAWLKEQGVTDVINFRTLFVSGLNFDEKEEVEALGMKYHNIPSVTRSPEKENITEFLNLVENIKKNNGKAHIHCKAGADRTGMYSLIYKSINHIGTRRNNIIEMLEMGHHYKTYPTLIMRTNRIIRELLKHNI